jgi:hypothetical protein
MNRFWASLAAAVVCCCALSGQEGLRLDSIRRIYVAQFTVKRGSGSLRNDVIAQLRKLNSITIVPAPSDADAILDGDGEIWVKGYQSLNPRSGRLPSDGTPFYSGFLSVELKDTKGDTLWSYLVTPGAPSENISRDLSKRLQKSLAEALSSYPPTAHP